MLTLAQFTVVNNVNLLHKANSSLHTVISFVWTFCDSGFTRVLFLYVVFF